MRCSPQGFAVAVTGAVMSKRLVTGTASRQGRNIFIHPGNSSMRQVSYGRIRLGADQKQVSFANEGQETGLICVGGAGVVSVGSERFTLKRDDALYVPKGLSIAVETAFQAGRLVAGVTRSLPGNWTSWPPHEHAAMLEEIYVFVDMPEPSFGLQLVYTDGISAAEVEVVRDGDAVLLPEGYHPNVAIPGAPLNFVWIMAAHREVVDRKWGVVQVDPRYA